jgi:hypothetical protein
MIIVQLRPFFDVFWAGAEAFGIFASCLRRARNPAETHRATGLATPSARD